MSLPQNCVRILPRSQAWQFQQPQTWRCHVDSAMLGLPWPEARQRRHLPGLPRDTAALRSECRLLQFLLGFQFQKAPHCSRAGAAAIRFPRLFRSPSWCRRLYHSKRKAHPRLSFRKRPEYGRQTAGVRLPSRCTWSYVVIMLMVSPSSRLRFETFCTNPAVADMAVWLDLVQPSGWPVCRKHQWWPKSLLQHDCPLLLSPTGPVGSQAAGPWKHHRWPHTRLGPRCRSVSRCKCMRLRQDLRQQLRPSGDRPGSLSWSGIPLAMPSQCVCLDSTEIWMLAKFPGSWRPLLPPLAVHPSVWPQALPGKSKPCNLPGWSWCIEPQWGLWTLLASTPWHTSPLCACHDRHHLCPALLRGAACESHKLIVTRCRSWLHILEWHSIWGTGEERLVKGACINACSRISVWDRGWRSHWRGHCPVHLGLGPCRCILRHRHSHLSSALCLTSSLCGRLVFFRRSLLSQNGYGQGKCRSSLPPLSNKQSPNFTKQVTSFHWLFRVYIGIHKVGSPKMSIACINLWYNI